MSKIILHQTYYLLTYFYVLKHFQNAILLQMQWVDFIEYLRPNWLNWIDEDDDKDKIDLKEKPENCRLGTVQVRQAWGHLALVSSPRSALKFG